MGATILTNEMVVSFLVWAFSVTGTALIGVLVWVSLGVVRKLNKIEASSTDQFAAFSKQLSTVHELVTQDIHRHDVRIVRLEEWRRAVDRSAPAES